MPDIDEIIDSENAYTPIEVNLIDETKSHIEEAVGIVASNDAQTGQVLFATGDGNSTWSNLDPDKIKLSADLYTYANIGKITGASQTNRIKVANEGDSLSAVFDAILGTQEDVDPTLIKQTIINVSQSSISVPSSDEIGTILPEASITLQISSILHSCKAQYGINYDDNISTYSDIQPYPNTEFVYPIRDKVIANTDLLYNFKIIAYNDADYLLLKKGTLESGSSISHTDDSSRTLYCKLNSNNIFAISLVLPLTELEAQQKNRLGRITLGAEMSYDSGAYQNKPVNFIYTYLGNTYIDSQQYIEGGNFTRPSNTNAYVASAGKYYPYSIASNQTSYSETVTGATKEIENIILHQTSSGAVDSDGSAGTHIALQQSGYIWIFIPEDKWNVSNTASLYQWAQGSWNKMQTTLFRNVSVELNSGHILQFSAYRSEELVPDDNWHIGVTLQ